jgi:predicted TIM-barrel fold metal-dependent hydrolase
MKYSSLVLFFLFGILNTLAQEMSFEEYNPKSTLVVSEHPTPRAKFKFIDVHSHQFRMAEQDLSTLIADMDKLNEGIMVNLSGGNGEGLKAMLKNVNENYPNRFAVFANVDFKGVGNPNWGVNAAKQLEEDIKVGAKGLKIYKSLGLRNNDINGKRIAIDDPRLDPIWAKCAEMGVPVLIHAADPKSFWDDMNSDNERWLELKTRPRRKRSATNPAPWQQIIDEQHRMFKKHPKQNL